MTEKDRQAAEKAADTRRANEAAPFARSAQAVQLPGARTMDGSPGDTKGTSPEEIAKMSAVPQTGNMPLGPGQVTGGLGVGRTAHATGHEPVQPAGGDRTPGTPGNPPDAKAADEATKREAAMAGSRVDDTNKR